jgi:catechol 2,3-dioxygenase-like lactoylglutathione lyase family enzyme
LTFKVTSLDHIVLNVSDVDRSLAFYVGGLGLEPVRLGEYRRGDVKFPSVRRDPDNNEIELSNYAME